MNPTLFLADHAASLQREFSFQTLIFKTLSLDARLVNVSDILNICGKALLLLPVVRYILWPVFD
jgi:hypothetical protein